MMLATPAAITAAVGALARRGVLVTRGHAIEALAQASHFVFDKTGTLTAGRMEVIGVIPLGTLDRTACLAVAARLERASEHPVGRAIVAAAAVLPVAVQLSDGLGFVALGEVGLA